jgi:hypothetical protein
VPPARAVSFEETGAGACRTESVRCGGLLGGHQAHQLRRWNPCMMVEDGIRAWRRAARGADGIEVQLGMMRSYDRSIC